MTPRESSAVGAERASGHAPGKLILTGEHSVVHGHRAVAWAIDRGTEVTLHVRPGPTRIESAPVQDERLAQAIAILLPHEGLGVSIRSTLPIGRGMGSSASLAVAIVRAHARLEGRTATFEECFELAFAAERHFHGTPSGIDHATVARGGVVVFDPKGPRFETLGLPSFQAVVLDSGVAGDTKALVAGVRADLPRTRPLLDEIGALTERVIAGLRHDADVAPEIQENHRLLQRLGLSTDRIEDLVKWALASGARAAKLSGAGGGGVVLALHDAPDDLLARASRAGIDAFAVRVVPSEIPEEAAP